MAGLYIHIPFCKSRCIYCAFYSTTDLALRQQYVDAVCREWLLRKGEVNGPIDTIYIGGGTPSQLTISQLRQLISLLSPANGLTTKYSPNEVTIECNPDDVTDEYAAGLQQLGINRVSMGAQTFANDRLRFLHRRHTAAQIFLAVQRLRKVGIRNISIDLMYGFPGETLDDWQRDIDAALALDVEHLSAYCLMVEKGTVLYEQMRNENQRSTAEGKVKWEMGNVNEEMKNDKAEELERQMYEVLIDKLEAAGYEHYEISNFARPGYRSRHNSSYWCDVPYIGLGAAAHSMGKIHTGVPPLIGGTASSQGGKQSICVIRSWNVSDIHQYIAAIEKGERPYEQEELDDDTHYNDRITTALRTSDGLDLATLSDHHRNYCLDEARPFLNDGLIRLTDNHLILTRHGLFVSDMVMSALMLV